MKYTCVLLMIVAGAGLAGAGRGAAAAAGDAHGAAAAGVPPRTGRLDAAGLPGGCGVRCVLFGGRFD
jgi:hypothetical protein